MSNRSYSKSNPEVELQQPREVKSTVEAGEREITLGKVSMRYQKPKETELPKAYIVIYSGGAKRERDYFSYIEKDNQFIRMEYFPCLKFYKGFVPAIFDDAIEKTKEYQSSANNEENPDSYYLITDVDEFRPSIVANRERCEAEKIQVIVSNPCFEVWLYYAYKDDKFVRFQNPNLDVKQLSQAVKKFVSEEVKGGCDPKKAFFNMEENIKNAKQNYEQDADGIPSLFSTDMYKLAQEIHPKVSGLIKELLAGRERGKN